MRDTQDVHVRGGEGDRRGGEDDGRTPTPPKRRPGGTRGDVCVVRARRRPSRTRPRKVKQTPPDRSAKCVRVREIAQGSAELPGKPFAPQKMLRHAASMSRIERWMPRRRTVRARATVRAPRGEFHMQTVKTHQTRLVGRARVGTLPHTSWRVALTCLFRCSRSAATIRRPASSTVEAVLPIIFLPRARARP